MTRSRRSADTLKSAGRRRFLKHLGAASTVGLSTTPAAALFNSILSGIGQKAWAQEMGVDSRMVNFMLPGGPCWTSILPLTAYGSAGFNRNVDVGSNYQNVGGRGTAVEWNTITTAGGVQYPLCWSYPIPTTTGSRPMSDMLADALVLQGVNALDPGHTGAQRAAWAPPGATQSVGALIPDAMNSSGGAAPLAAVNLRASEYENTWRSSKGKTFVTPSMGGNIIQNLLNPFTHPASLNTFKGNRTALREAWNKVLPILSDNARYDVSAQAILDNRDAAFRLFDTNFGNLTSIWDTLVAKYTDLVTRSFDIVGQPLPGLTTIPIGHGGTGAPIQYFVNNENVGLHTSADLRTMIGPMTTIPNLARSFALTEWLLLNDITRSISADIDNISGLVRPDSALFGVGHDQHDTGNLIQLLVNTLSFRAIMACMNELISVLQTNNLFDKTLLMLFGEFTRDPRGNGTGSDHGYEGAARFLFHGALNTRGMALGNLRNDGRQGWGAGGNVAEYGRPLAMPDVITAAAQILKIPSPFTAAQSPITMTPNGAVANIQTSRWV